MIIELFGLPGSGKTTCCNLVEKKFNIKNPMNFYRNTIVGKIKFRLFLKFFRLNKELLNKYNKLVSILNDKTYKNNIDSKIDINLYLKYILFTYYIEKKYEKHSIIIDEGIVHYCIALYAEFDVEYNQILKINEMFQMELKTNICLKSDIETSISQMIKRSRKVSAIDFLDKNQLIDILNKYNNGIKFFLKDNLCLSEQEITEYIEGEQLNEL